MSRLFELYVEGVLLKNQELHDLARRLRDERRIHSTIVARTMREIQHKRTVILDVEDSVMEEVKGKFFSAETPPAAFVPDLPISPLFFDFGESMSILREALDQAPDFQGMMFCCPGDRDVLREARGLLSSRYHASIEEVINRDQTTWTLSCVDAIGEEIVIYHYRFEEGTWVWCHYGMHHCPFGLCQSANGVVETLCKRCESIKSAITLLLGIILLYDAGYFQEAVVIEEKIHLSSTMPGISTTQEAVTRTVRHLRKNVLVKEFSFQSSVTNPRGSWLARHDPSEIVEKRKKRGQFQRRTAKGTLITVTPTQEKRIPMLKKNVPVEPENTVVTLYAEPPRPSAQKLLADSEEE